MKNRKRFINYNYNKYSMRWFTLLILVFAVGFVVADSTSSTESNFTIAGCTDGLALGSCSADGNYYCNEAGASSIKTMESVLACSMGKSSYMVGEAQCCPEGFTCTNSGCEFANCESINNQEDCEESEKGCLWFDDGEDASCISGFVEGLGCGDYKTSLACTKDIYNLATKKGWKAEDCEGAFVDCTFSFVINGCDCAWNPVGYCYLAKNITQEIYGDKPFVAQCRTNSTLSNVCVDGKKTVTWTSELVTVPTVSWGKALTPADELCLETKVCDSGSKQVDCAKPLLKLPVFSSFAFVMSIFMIYAVYYFKRK